MGLRVCFQFAKGCSRHVGVSEVPACPRGDQRDSEKQQWSSRALGSRQRDHRVWRLWTGRMWLNWWMSAAGDPLGHKYALEEAINFYVGYTYLGPFCFGGLLKIQESQRCKEGDNHGSHPLSLKASCVLRVRAIHYRLNILGKILITVGKIICQL